MYDSINWEVWALMQQTSRPVVFTLLGKYFFMVILAHVVAFSAAGLVYIFGRKELARQIFPACAAVAFGFGAVYLASFVDSTIRFLNALAMSGNQEDVSGTVTFACILLILSAVGSVWATRRAFRFLGHAVLSVMQLPKEAIEGGMIRSSDGNPILVDGYPIILTSSTITAVYNLLCPGWGYIHSGTRAPLSYLLVAVSVGWFGVVLTQDISGLFIITGIVLASVFSVDAFVQTMRRNRQRLVDTNVAMVPRGFELLVRADA